MPERKEGLGKALAELHNPAAGPAAAARQLRLLAELGEGAEVVPERRGRGRPKGSKNRRTEEWTRYLLGSYGSPLEALARVMRAGPERLAAELGVDLVQGFDRWLRVCEALAPYLHQKQPVAVAVDQVPTAPIVIGVSQAFAAAMGAEAAAARGSLQIVFGQRVAARSSGALAAQSNGAESNDAG